LTPLISAAEPKFSPPCGRLFFLVAFFYAGVQSAKAESSSDMIELESILFSSLPIDERVNSEFDLYEDIFFSPMCGTLSPCAFFF